MSILEKLRSAVTPIIPICVPGDYDGDEAEYCVFHADSDPQVFADGLPEVIAAPIVLDWYCPKGKNPLHTKRALSLAIADAGFTYPYIVDGSDSKTQRYTFEFSGIEESADGGV